MSRWKPISVAIVAILVIVVVLQNTQAVETKLLLVSVTMPRAVLLFITLAIGFVIGMLAAQKLTRMRAAKDDGS